MTPGAGESVGRRLAAWVALLAAAAFVAGVVVLAIRNTSALLVALAALTVTGAAGWVAVTHRGTIRAFGGAAAAAALIGGALALVVAGALPELLALIAAGSVFVAATSRAIRSTRTSGSSHPTRSRGKRRSSRGVLVVNPRSGAKSADHSDLASLARRRGIKIAQLGSADDLHEVARAAARSAEVIGVAGGDGSQAAVAQVAIEYGLPLVCVPAGTRNHFGLDLGLDTADVVGALDAFASHIERRVDVGYINDRLFLNNVSLGVYAQLVQSDAYREAKLGTTETMLPELLGPDAKPFDLRFARPDGTIRHGARLILVSNNPYTLDRLLGFGSRPRLDAGRLGIVAVEITSAAEAATFVALESLGQIRHFDGWTEWSARIFEVDSSSPVAAGIDGEAAVLDPPLRFTISPAALRVRLPPTASGMSPAAQHPGLTNRTVLKLWKIANGRP
jgi:diacylglycerol kinase family enzyme